MKTGRRGPIISHLMFADDLLLFWEATVNQMKVVLDYLEKFCSMSGQQVHAQETLIFFSKNVDNEV